MGVFWFVRLLASLCGFRHNSTFAKCSNCIRFKARRNCGLLAGNSRPSFRFANVNSMTGQTCFRVLQEFSKCKPDEAEFNGKCLGDYLFWVGACKGLTSALFSTEWLTLISRERKNVVKMVCRNSWKNARAN